MSKTEAPTTPPTMAAVFGLREDPPLVADVWDTSGEVRGFADLLGAPVVPEREEVNGGTAPVLEREVVVGLVLAAEIH
jgi:hypothetical protein